MGARRHEVRGALRTGDDRRRASSSSSTRTPATTGCCVPPAILGARYVRLWESGLLDRLPSVIDHAVVAAAFDGEVGMVLLRDVSSTLLDPERPFTGRPARAVHRSHGGVARHLLGMDRRCGTDRARAAVSDALSGGGDSPKRPEAATPLCPRSWPKVGGGCPRCRPRWRRWCCRSSTSPSALLAALQRSAAHPGPRRLEGRQHWARTTTDARCSSISAKYPGEASPLADLAWYLALNAALLPESKDDVVERYRASLESHGVDTSGWWEARGRPRAPRLHAAVRLGEGARRHGAGACVVGGRGAAWGASPLTTRRGRPLRSRFAPRPHDAATPRRAPRRP